MNTFVLFGLLAVAASANAGVLSGGYGVAIAQPQLIRSVQVQPQYVQQQLIAQPQQLVRTVQVAQPQLIRSVQVQPQLVQQQLIAQPQLIRSVQVQPQLVQQQLIAQPQQLVRTVQVAQPQLVQQQVVRSVQIAQPQLVQQQLIAQPQLVRSVVAQPQLLSQNIGYGNYGYNSLSHGGLVY